MKIDRPYIYRILKCLFRQKRKKSKKIKKTGNVLEKKLKIGAGK